MNLIPPDLNAINYQRQFIENAINYYARQIESQQRTLQELKTQSIWNLNWNNQEQITRVEKNIYFQRYLISQYQQLLFSLKQMWDVYIFENSVIPMDLSN